MSFENIINMIGTKTETNKIVKTIELNFQKLDKVESDIILNVFIFNFCVVKLLITCKFLIFFFFFI